MTRHSQPRTQAHIRIPHTSRAQPIFGNGAPNPPSSYSIPIVPERFTDAEGITDHTFCLTLTHESATLPYRTRIATFSLKTPNYSSVPLALTTVNFDTPDSLATPPQPLILSPLTRHTREQLRHFLEATLTLTEWKQS